MTDPRINLDTITGRVNAKAIEIIEASPNGVRWVELQREIKKYDETLHPKTVNGCVWLLAEKFPDKVFKPEKGLFMATKYKGQ